MSVLLCVVAGHEVCRFCEVEPHSHPRTHSLTHPPPAHSLTRSLTQTHSPTHTLSVTCFLLLSLSLPLSSVFRSIAQRLARTPAHGGVVVVWHHSNFTRRHSRARACTTQCSERACAFCVGRACDAVLGSRCTWSVERGVWSVEVWSEWAACGLSEVPA